MRKFVLGALCALSFGCAAQAADSPSAFNWTGFYVGLDAGGLSGNGEQRVPSAVATAHLDPQGFVGGAHLGYLWQMNPRVVLGIEGDIWSSTADGEAPYRGFVNTAIVNVNWGASLRGIIGTPIMNSALIYATGGVSTIDIDGCTTPGVPGICAAGSKFDDRKTGWVVGAGLAYAITPQISARVEYLYANYGKDNYSTPGVGTGITTVDLETHIVRLGFSYRFATY